MITLEDLRTRAMLAVITVQGQLRGRGAAIVAAAACFVILFGMAWLIGQGQGEH
jgi:hypothetical protein